jgi:hypothetical protein
MSLTPYSANVPDNRSTWQRRGSDSRKENLCRRSCTCRIPLPKVNGPPYSIAHNAAFSSSDDDQMESFLNLHCSSNVSHRSEQAQVSGYSWDARQDPTKRRSKNDPDGLTFIQGSRLNHSCDPNIYYSRNPSTGHGRFYAVRNITPGEELTISYLPFSTWKKATRQRLLLLDHHFSCSCILCSDSFGATATEEELKEYRAKADLLSKKIEVPVLTDWIVCRAIAKEMLSLQGYKPAKESLDL